MNWKTYFCKAKSYKKSQEYLSIKVFVEVILIPKAKQEIYERHKSKDDFRMLRGFEKAMSKFVVSRKDDNGVKEYKKWEEKLPN